MLRGQNYSQEFKMNCLDEHTRRKLIYFGKQIPNSLFDGRGERLRVGWVYISILHRMVRHLNTTLHAQIDSPMNTV